MYYLVGRGERKLLCEAQAFSTSAHTKLFSPKWREKRGEKFEAYGGTKLDSLFIALNYSSHFPIFCNLIILRLFASGNYILSYFTILKSYFYQLYHTILQYSQHPNFYFTIQHIKIIFLHNKIIYPKILSFLSHLSPLSNFYLSSSCNFHRSLNFRRGGEIVRSHNLIQPLSQCRIYNNTQKIKITHTTYSKLIQTHK